MITSAPVKINITLGVKNKNKHETYFRPKILFFDLQAHF